MAHMRRDRVLWHIGLKLSVMWIYCTNFHVSVPHVIYSTDNKICLTLVSTVNRGYFERFLRSTLNIFYINWGKAMIPKLYLGLAMRLSILYIRKKLARLKCRLGKIGVSYYSKFLIPCGKQVKFNGFLECLDLKFSCNCNFLIFLHLKMICRWKAPKKKT